MLRSIGGGLALVVSSLTVLAGAPKPADDPSSLPMHFALHEEGPAESCGAGCRRFIAASGMITADTPRAFEAFVRAHDVRGATVVLESRGGSVLGAIALGRAIRAQGLATTVGRVKEQPSGDRGKSYAVLSPDAACQSMCAFVLLGGVSRSVSPASRVLVHQIWLGDRREDAVAASYSAEDLAIVQRDIGKLAQYTMEMGGAVELLEVALRIPPWEPMRALSRDELRRMRLDNADDAVTPTAAPSSPSVRSNSDAAAAPATEDRHAEAGQRGWVLVERPSRPTLTRRHPLTVEGERIGTFELALACGNAPATYTVTYSEWRGSPPAERTQVKQVQLWIAGTELPLDIVSSRAGADSQQVETLARGKATAEIVQSFADAPSASLMVRTESAGNQRTAIRVGSMGFAHGFSRLAAACAATSARLDTHAELRATRGAGGQTRAQP